MYCCLAMINLFLVKRFTGFVAADLRQPNGVICLKLFSCVTTRKSALGFPLQCSTNYAAVQELNWLIKISCYGANTRLFSRTAVYLKFYLQSNTGLYWCLHWFILVSTPFQFLFSKCEQDRGLRWTVAENLRNSVLNFNFCEHVR